MLSHRDPLRASAAVAAAATIGAVAAPPALAASHATIEDMALTLFGEFPTYFGPGFSAEQNFKFAESGFTLSALMMNMHRGTHIDAPLRVSADGNAVDEIPVSNLVAPLYVVDIAAKADGDVDAQVTPNDLKAWIAANGDIPAGARVAMHSGWGAKTEIEAHRGFDGEKQHHPSFHVEAAQRRLRRSSAHLCDGLIDSGEGKRALAIHDK